MESIVQRDMQNSDRGANVILKDITMQEAVQPWYTAIIRALRTELGWWFEEMFCRPLVITPRLWGSAVGHLGQETKQRCYW